MLFNGYGLGATNNDIAAAERSIPALIEMGIVSFKGFTAYKKRGMKLEDEEILKIMGLITRHNGVFATHCENGPILDLLEDSAIARGDVKPEHYPPTHPGISHSVPQKNVFTKVDYSLYEGFRCLGAPTLVIQRGQVVMENGNIKAEPGQGRFLAGQLT